MATVPHMRISKLNDAPRPSNSRYVLYWMTANRRARFNFALQHALNECHKLKLPLVVLEALRCDYRWASDRFHAYVMQGMADNAATFAEIEGVRYYPYVEPDVGAGKGLLKELSKDAALIVTDEFPSFFLPNMQASAARQVQCPMVAVDSNGILPLRACEGREFTRAYSFRIHLHKVILPHLEELPLERPLKETKLPKTPSIPRETLGRWPEASTLMLGADVNALAKLPINHNVGVVGEHGGESTGLKQVRRFLRDRFERYETERNEPGLRATSELSAYLHFGHVSAHEVMRQVFEREDWSPDKIRPKGRGKRHGWWGLSQTAEAFIDELVTWREIGYNCCHLRNDYDAFESLPDFAKTTLREHWDDPREYVYVLEQFENADTHDEVWNAAQRQLVREGRIHNYLRMVWGKKILHWSRNPEAALEIMIELNNKYAIDGRNPNSYSGIMWTLGRYDRAWGPEREVFGKIRYMCSKRTKQKFDLAPYLKEYGAAKQGELF